MVNEKIKCDICGKFFDSKEQTKQHKQSVHVNKNAIKSSKSKSHKALIAIGILAVIIGGGIYWSQTLDNSLVIDGIRCDLTEFVDYHIHAHLDIFIDGQPYTIPAGVGIKPNTC